MQYSVVIKRGKLFEKFTITYDVSSLFTSIPLNVTIDIAENLIFGKYLSLKITREQLIKLFGFATSATHFLFAGNYYDQIVFFSSFSLLEMTLKSFPQA